MFQGTLYCFDSILQESRKSSLLCRHSLESVDNTHGLKRSTSGSPCPESKYLQVISNFRKLHHREGMNLLDMDK
jgi:hypothetical protein